MLMNRLVKFASLVTLVTGRCFEPDPAFPVPTWQNGQSQLRAAFEMLEHKLESVASQPKYANSSYSIEVTSKTETLWTNYHTAKNHNESRPGDTNISSSSQYRIASCTKVFTVLAILHQAKAGNLSLDDPVLQYLGELDSKDYELPWKDITLRALASQLSGIPREFAQSDLFLSLPNPQAYGFPYIPKEDIPIACDAYDDHGKPCTPKDLYTQLKSFQPLFAPNQKSTYSNLNYELLGLVIENVTGIPYKEYIQAAIFDPLNMTESTLNTPATTDLAVLPLGPNFWDVDLGVQNPTGGIYASSGDVSKFLRYVLMHYNSLATGVNWLLPSSWSGSMYSFYGMPWEIFRTDKILPDTRRPVTFASKSGGLPGYFTRMLVLEDYGLGLTILVGGHPDLLNELVEAVSVPLVRAAEEAVWADVYATHHGHYTARDPATLNSSITLAVSQRKGLYVTSFVSNATDVLATLFDHYPGVPDPAERRRWHLQLMPTLLFEDEEKGQGEIWRALPVTDRADPADGGDTGIWEDFCITDVDPLTYATVPLNKVVFWHEEGVVELPAFRVKLKRTAEEGAEDSRFVVQE